MSPSFPHHRVDLESIYLASREHAAYLPVIADEAALADVILARLRDVFGDVVAEGGEVREGILRGIRDSRNDLSDPAADFHAVLSRLVANGGAVPSATAV